MWKKQRANQVQESSDLPLTVEPVQEYGAGILPLPKVVASCHCTRSCEALAKLPLEVDRASPGFRSFVPPLRNLFSVALLRCRQLVFQVVARFQPAVLNLLLRPYVTCDSGFADR